MSPPTTIHGARRLTPVRSASLPVGAPRAVILGTGRSGSGYIQRVLAGVGLQVGHEHWWAYRDSRRVPWLDVDSSWLATFEPDLPPVVWAQVRHPVPCVASIATHEFEDGPWLPWRTDHMELTGDRWRDACRAYVHWNRAALDRAERWWRVEDVDAWLVVALARRLGTTVEHDVALDAIAAVDPATNNRNRPATDGLPEVAEADEVRMLARELGYTDV